jgi:hypothetical protein
MPDGSALIHWLERALPLEHRVTVPEALWRIAEVFASRGANLGANLALDTNRGVTIEDAVLLAGFHSHRFTTALAEIVRGELLTAAGDQESALRLPTADVVAMLRRSAEARCAAEGRQLGSTQS